MSRDTLTAVRTILSTVCGRDAATINPGDRLNDLGVDSLDRVLIAVLVEKVSGRVMPDEVLAAMTTVTDIERHLNSEGATP